MMIFIGVFSLNAFRAHTVHCVRRDVILRAARVHTSITRALVQNLYIIIIFFTYTPPKTYLRIRLLRCIGTYPLVYELICVLFDWNRGKYRFLKTTVYNKNIVYKRVIIDCYFLLSGENYNAFHMSDLRGFLPKRIDDG